jgi:peptidoglycan hydrolase-like protein with peptidoglycan-binding domain
MEVENMRKLILTSVSVLALAIGGASVGFAAGPGNSAVPNAQTNMPAATGNTQYVPNAGANMPSTSGMPQQEQTAVNAPRNEIRQAQGQLRDQGLYHGRIDGVLGPETKQALQQFQQKNGLPATATLDQQTMDKLLGNTGVGLGSSMPPSSNQGIGSTANQRLTPPAASNLGDHNTPNR